MPASVTTVERGSRGERAAYAMLAAMAVFFGGTWVTGAWAVTEVPPFAVAVIRFGIAAILLSAWARLTGARLAPVRPRDIPLIVGMGLTAIAGYNWLFLTGITLAPASDGAIIVPGIAPVATVILAALVLGERLGMRGMAGMALSLVGLVLVVTPGSGAGGDRLVGDLLFVLGAVCWGVYTMLSRIASRRFDALSISLYGMLLGAVMLVPAAVLEGGLATIVDASPRALIGIAYLAVFGSVGAFILLNLGVARIGAARAAAFAFLVPIVGVLTSVWLLGEELTPLTLLGGAVVLAGLWLVQHRPNPAPASRAGAEQTARGA